MASLPQRMMVVLFLCFSVSSVDARVINGFVGPFSPENWTTQHFVGNKAKVFHDSQSIIMEINNPQSSSVPISELLVYRIEALNIEAFSFDLEIYAGMFTSPSATGAFTARNLGVIISGPIDQFNFFRHYDVLHSFPSFAIQTRNNTDFVPGNSFFAEITNFSATVPEPSILALLALGLAVFGVNKRKLG